MVIEIGEKNVGEEISHHDAEDQTDEASQEVFRRNLFQSLLGQKGQGCKEKSADEPQERDRGRRRNSLDEKIPADSADKE
jgi:hypothetical protein